MYKLNKRNVKRDEKARSFIKNTKKTLKKDTQTETAL
jgi:hypothetical protein